MTIRIVAMDERTRQEVRLPTAAELPKWLAVRRTDANLSLQELAKNLSQRGGVPISRQSIHNWETGTAMPSVDHLALLVSYFGGDKGEEIAPLSEAEAVPSLATETTS